MAGLSWPASCRQVIVKLKLWFGSHSLSLVDAQRFLGSWHDFPILWGGCGAWRHSPSSSPGPQQSLLSPVQLLSSLTECLTVDALSASVWRQLYPKHLSQSRQVGLGGCPPLIHTEKP